MTIRTRRLSFLFGNNSATDLRLSKEVTGRLRDILFYFLVEQTVYQDQLKNSPICAQLVLTVDGVIFSYDRELETLQISRTDCALTVLLDVDDIKEAVSLVINGEAKIQNEKFKVDFAHLD